ncbi:NHL repeat-containing protein [Calditrichota bacterium]
MICIVNGQIKIQELGRFGGTGTNHDKFKNPSAIDANDQGQVFICDRGNNRIQVFNEKGIFIKDIGGFGSKNEQFDEPKDIWARTTLNIFIADYNNQRVQRFDRELNFLSSFYSNDGDDERFQFREILSVAYSSQGDLFVLEAGENKVIKFQRETAQAAFGFLDSGVGELYDPAQIDITAEQKIIVSDPGNDCVNIYDYFGNYLTSIIHKDMQSPSGLAVDNSGRIYISDSSAKKVFIVANNGKMVSEINSIAGNNLVYPVDMCLVAKGNNKFTGYLIDGDEVIIFALQYNLSGE